MYSLCLGIDDIKDINAVFCSKNLWSIDIHVMMYEREKIIYIFIRVLERDRFLPQVRRNFLSDEA